MLRLRLTLAVALPSVLDVASLVIVPLKSILLGSVLLVALRLSTRVVVHGAMLHCSVILLGALNHHEALNQLVHVRVCCLKPEDFTLPFTRHSFLVPLDLVRVRDGLVHRMQ